jgi:hypothetical protein
MNNRTRIIDQIEHIKHDSHKLAFYYDKCFENLMYANKRSNRITQYIVLVIVVYIFTKPHEKITIFNMIISLDTFKVLTPLMVIYLLFEWIMLGLRRRDLIVAMQHINTILLKMPPMERFPSFNPSSLNLIPVSLMLEAYNMRKSKWNRWLFIGTIIFVAVFLAVFITVTFLYSFSYLPIYFPTIVMPHLAKAFITYSYASSIIAVCILLIFWCSSVYYNDWKNPYLKG